MREIRIETITLEQANAAVGEELPPGMWEFLVGRLSYSEIRFDPEAGGIRYPGFIPIEQLLREGLEEVRRGGVDPRPCRVCSVYHDVNSEEGIFARPDALEGFICEACAREMSAWTFFHEHLT